MWARARTHSCTCQTMCEGQRTTCEICFLSFMWVSGIKLSSTGLSESAFTYWVSILLALKTYPLYINISTVCVGACTNLGTAHAGLVPAEARKGWWILWNQSYRELWTIMWMLGYSEHVSPGNTDLGTCRERMFNYSLIQASVQFIVPYMFHKCVMILFHVDNGI